MKLAIVGSRLITEEQEGFSKAIIQGILMYYLPIAVFSGGAEGIDTIAETESIVLNIHFKLFKPVKPQWEPDGYKIRNMNIAEECTDLLCIRSKQSTTYGSGWTADYAEKLGKNVIRITV